MQSAASSDVPTREESEPGKDPDPGFRVGQRVHTVGNVRRIGTVKYVGPVEGIPGIWVGVDWDNDGEGKHDGSHNGVQYFQARGPKTAAFARPSKLSSGITLLEALEVRYRSTSTKEEEGMSCCVSLLRCCTPCFKVCIFLPLFRRASIYLMGFNVS